MMDFLRNLWAKIWNWTTYAEYYSYRSGAKGWRRRARVLRIFRKRIAERKCEPPTWKASIR
jgi:hypothetical protein